MSWILTHIVQVSITVLATTATAGIITVVVKFLREWGSLKGGVLAIGYDRLHQACLYHLSNGSITYTELKNLEHLYKGYSGLGGNGLGELLYRQCECLPIIHEKDLSKDIERKQDGNENGNDEPTQK